ncbi:MAG TPA: hypothetical protein VJK30_04340 [Coxiellaceae bacterium]|nr:MAG: hypothetical protein A3E81_07640 [Gammaproteobacteria bacterium RIFCSPHIGHO2_12_FULL_36_30]HLB56539.1 hypothetical protein [Coxiellaceae bacterium]
MAKSKISKILEHALVTTLIAGAIGLLISDYFSFKKKMYEGLNQIQNEVALTVFQDEVAYKFCTLYRIHSSNIYGSFNDIEEYKLIEKLANNFASVIDSLHKMGKFVPYKTFEAIQQLNCWQNKVFSSSKRICESHVLSTPTEMDAWRIKINIMLEANRREYHGTMYSIGEYFAYIFTNKINEQYEYTSECSKFSKYSITPSFQPKKSR